MDVTYSLDDFLESVVNIFYSQQELCSEEVLEQSAVTFFEYYKRNINGNEKFYSELLMALDGDEKLYTMVISTIYKLTRDSKAITVLEDMLLNRDVDVYWADSILRQMNYDIFTTSNIQMSYERSRKINQKLLHRYLERHPNPFSYTPYDKRNNKRIVIETNTLLSPQHAPSGIVLEVCKSLQCDYGYEVFLVVNRDYENEEEILQCWYEPIKFNYNSEMENQFVIEYCGVKIKGFQFEWSDSKIDNRDAVLELIDLWKPLCVFHIGGASYRHDIYRNQTTLISMPCNAGYIVSEAQVLFSYMNDESQYMKDGIRYIKEQGQLTKAIDNFGCPEMNVEYIYKKRDFGLAEESFAICIMGNRLNEELSSDFINMLEEVARRKKEVQFVIIGECDKGFFSRDLQNRVKYLGYRDDFVEVMAVMDLFANPIRKGGGGGATRALGVGVPVVTLRNCDVYSLVGEPYGCDDLDMMKNTIIRYIEDSEFYALRTDMAGEWYKKHKSVDRNKLFHTLINEVEIALKEGHL